MSWLFGLRSVFYKKNKLKNIACTSDQPCQDWVPPYNLKERFHFLRMQTNGRYHVLKPLAVEIGSSKQKNTNRALFPKASGTSKKFGRLRDWVEK